MKRLWDISPPVSATSPVFPGDTAYTQKWKWSLEPGCPVNVSEITMSPHIGAHADARCTTPTARRPSAPSRWSRSWAPAG